MFYRCIKVQQKPINTQDRVQIQRSKETECALVWRIGLSGVPSDSVRCTMTVQSQTRHSRVFPGALRYNSPDCPVHQRSNGYFAQRSCAKVALTATVKNSAHRVRAQKSEAHRTVNSVCLVRHRTVRCHLKTNLQRSTAPEP